MHECLRESVTVHSVTVDLVNRGGELIWDKHEHGDEIALNAITDAVHQCPHAHT